MPIYKIILKSGGEIEFLHGTMGLYKLRRVRIETSKLNSFSIKEEQEGRILIVRSASGRTNLKVDPDKDSKLHSFVTGKASWRSIKSLGIKEDIKQSCNRIIDPHP